jgi:hypothetical protein
MLFKIGNRKCIIQEEPKSSISEEDWEHFLLEMMYFYLQPKENSFHGSDRNC